MNRERWVEMVGRHDSERQMFKLDFPLEAEAEQSGEAFFAVSRELQDVQARYTAAQKRLNEATARLEAANREAAAKLEVMRKAQEEPNLDSGAEV